MINMIRADVSMRDLHRWMGTRRLRDPDHAFHCLLTESFGIDLAPKPFRLIAPRAGARGTLYGYGNADVAALREASSLYACPLQARVIPAGSLNSKPMPTKWQVGKRLGFEVRIRPTRRLKRPKENGGESHIAERDAFLMQALDEKNVTRNREEVYREWLSERLNARGGAELDVNQTYLMSFQRTRAFRKLRARYSEGPDVVMRGVLTVTDANTFIGLLARGIGRHRAYGYGMLLLRPVPGSPRL